MKQNITLEQLKELNESQIVALEKKMYDGNSHYLKCVKLVSNIEEQYLIELSNTLTIGQMIEILENNVYYFDDITREWVDGVGEFDWNIKFIPEEVIDMDENEDIYGQLKVFSDLELCDALWEAVKAILE